jgi:hypothetical protein
MLSTGLWRWYINITIAILDIINRPVSYLKHDVSETWFCLLQVDPTQFVPVRFEYSVYRFTAFENNATTKWSSVCLPPEPKWGGSRRRSNHCYSPPRELGHKTNNFFIPRVIDSLPQDNTPSRLAQAVRSFSSIQGGVPDCNLGQNTD